MDPTAPMTSRDFAQAMWAIALGMAAPWVIIVPIWLLIERYRDRKASWEAQAGLQAWEVAHPREAPDEHARLVQIRDQLWLESLTPDARAYILRRRLEETEREARALWQAERQAQQGGHDRAGGP